MEKKIYTKKAHAVQQTICIRISFCFKLAFPEPEQEKYVDGKSRKVLAKLFFLRSSIWFSASHNHVF